MSPRTHFWLRIAGLTLIVLAEVIPRVSAHAPASHGAPVGVAAEVAHR
jgi:hypothetical protein